MASSYNQPRSPPQVTESKLALPSLLPYNPRVRIFSFLLFTLFLVACASARIAPTPTIALAAQTLSTQAPVVTPTLTPSPPPAINSQQSTVNNQRTTTPNPLPPSATPTPLPPAPPIPTLAPIGIILQQANLRGGPGVGYPIVGEIGAGQEVTAIAQTAAGDWVRLDLDDEEQTWIAAFLIDLPAGLELPIAATLPPPPASPTPGDIVAISNSAITLPTYPWQQFTTPAYDEAAHWEYRQFDRAAYEASNPQPAPQTYRLVGLENRWLRLTLMPELGGRLYQMIFKPTGSNELYQNPVIKPSPWGPGPDGNGWLAAGGIEWGLPAVEHGYAWADAWGYITEPAPPSGAVTVFTQDRDRLQLNVRVGLQPDSAAFTLDFDMENRADAPIVASYWTNAMLAPGPANRAGPDLHFLFPGNRMVVHSTGEVDLPSAGGAFSWPNYNGRDLSRLGVWERWLGFFAYPQAQAGWSAVYDTSADEGVVRIFPPQQVPGLKGFGFGWGDPITPDNYTDDDSSYVEMHGGLTPTFSQSFTLAPGQTRAWQETWYPVAGIGGVTAADAQGAVNLTSTTDGLRLRLFSVASRGGELTVSGSGGELLRTPFSLDPAHPADLALPGAQPPLSFHLRAASGADWRMIDLLPDQANISVSLFLPRLLRFDAPPAYALYLPTIGA